MSETENTASFVDLSNMPSMEDLMKAEETQKKEFTRGKIIEGTIVKKRADGVLVDIGYKAEGFVPAAQFLRFNEVEEGQKIDVYLEEIENEYSMPTISLEKAESQKAWNKITTEYTEGSIVKGFMRQRVKGGIMVDVEGFPAFLPGSQLDIGQVRNMDEYIGNEYDIKIIKIRNPRYIK
jgi:small subunit ribosomal protein S1